LLSVFHISHFFQLMPDTLLSSIFRYFVSFSHYFISMFHYWYAISAMPITTPLPCQPAG
jgi:hypothetical protein